MKRLLALILTAAATVACSYGYFDDGAMHMSEKMSALGTPEPAGGESAYAGILTAGEWCDLQHWDFWGELMTRKTENQPQEGGDPAQMATDYGKMACDWGFNTVRRVAVKVTDTNGNPAVNLPVELLLEGAVIWCSRTSNEGEAQLWDDLFSARGQEKSSSGLQVRIAGSLQQGSPVVSTYAGQAEVNNYTVKADIPQAKADIAFIVDATGSMGDELEFLKKDLLSILERLQQSQSGTEVRTGAVFYRDNGDDYITRSNDFTTASATMSFIKKQSANGGGDLPEAVHSALETGLQKLSWNDKARARIAFLILDAPAHIDHEGVVESLQASIRSYSQLGIRIIPVLASTGDKSTEFMCRDFAIVTGGTYVFLTDDSGVGESHLIPTVGEYQVEKLNELLYRLMEAYIK